MKTSIVTLRQLIILYCIFLSTACKKDTLASIVDKNDTKEVGLRANAISYGPTNPNIHVMINLNAYYNPGFGGIYVDASFDLGASGPYSDEDIQGYDLNVKITKGNNSFDPPSSGASFAFPITLPASGEDAYVVTAIVSRNGRQIASKSITVYVNASGEAGPNTSGGDATYTLYVDDPYYSGGPYTLKINDIYVDFSSVEYKDVYMFAYFIPFTTYPTTTYYEPAQLIYLGPINQNPGVYGNHISVDMPQTYDRFKPGLFVVFFSTNYKDNCIAQPLYEAPYNKSIVNYCLHSIDNTYAPFLPGYLDSGYPLSYNSGTWETKINALDKAIWYNVKYFTDGTQYSPCN